MTITNMAASAVADKLPKVINPKTHAFIDYAMAGTFFVLGAMFWKRNKRAAIAATLCGAATAATSLLTDYPGGVKRVISFHTHGRIDAGLAGMTAAAPNFLAFNDDDEARIFRILALAETAVTGLTDFESSTGRVIEMPHYDTA